MEDVYDLYKHTHCVVIWIKKRDVYIEIYPNICRSRFVSEVEESHSKDDLIHDSKIEDPSPNKSSSENGIPIDSFMEALHRLFEKGKDNWDEDDKPLMRAASDFLSRKVKKSIQELENSIETLNALHYAFVVPYKWNENIREEIIRPIFIQSGLISSEDHQDRLLFFTDIESICYSLQNTSTTINPLKRGQNSIFCRFSSAKKNEALIKLDLIQTTNNLFNFSGSLLFPKVMNSSSLSISEDYIKSSLKEFLSERIFPRQEDANKKRRSMRKFLKDELLPEYEDHIIIEAMAEDIYSGKLPDLDICNKDYPQIEYWIQTKKRWLLSKEQKLAIKSIYPIDICAKISKPFFDAMKNILLNNFMKEYTLFPLEDKYSTNIDLDNRLLKWVSRIMEYNRRRLNDITKITVVDIPSLYALHAVTITEGAGFGVLEALKSSNINSRPRILDTDIFHVSSSLFLNSKANPIINIDISLKFTKLSLSLLSDEGLIEKIFDHNYFTNEKCLPSLESFYQVSCITTLTVKERFISFADECLINDLKKLSNNEDNHVRSEKNIYDIEKILNKDLSTTEALISVRQKVYIKAFLLMYMIYLKSIILSKLPDYLKWDDTSIGYAVSVEKFLLDGVSETINSLKEIIYTSGLVRKDDSSKKLKIITQGEGMLPAIQKYVSITLPLKSYFILAQLHESYMQLTLNQTVTCLDLNGDQESIIIEDRIVPIENIHGSLCQNLWNYLIENSHLIRLCDDHINSDTNKILDIFSLKTKKEFENNLKQYISENTPAGNTNLQCSIKTALQLNESCNCKIHLSADDIIDISFKPVLQGVIFDMSTSLLNKGLFGNYENIHCIFTIICFSYNSQFRHRFQSILQEESDEFNSKYGLYTHFLTIPALSDLNLQPVLKLKHHAYKSFHIGNFRQVSSENYAFSIGSTTEESNPLFKNKLTDVAAFEYGYTNVFPLLKMGEILDDVQLKRIFYLKPQNYQDKRYIPITLFKYKTLDNLEYNGTATLANNNVPSVDTTYPLFLYDKFKLSGCIPVIISVKSQGYSSSLLFSVNVLGEDIKRSQYIETGEPLTLS